MTKDANDNPPPPPRPVDHPEELPWPPEIEKNDDPPNWYDDTESQQAFFEEKARSAFGDKFVDRLMSQMFTFRGDWWAFAMLARCMQAARELDPDGNDPKRYAWWNRFVAQPTLPATHLEGIQLFRGDLRHALLAHAHLEHAQLSYARLEHAVLDNARLNHAKLNSSYLQHARITAAELRHADLSMAHLDHASFTASQLNNAILDGTYLVRTGLVMADMSHVRMWSAHAGFTQLRHARFDHADVRGTDGLLFDECPVERLHIEGNASDPWSVLRRTYTGPRYFVHLMLLIAFLIPFAVRVFQLSAISEAQSAIATAAAAQQDMPWRTQLEAWIEGFEGTHHQIGAWWVLIGGDKGLFFVALTLTLVVYNACRGLLTWNVSSLRDAEERSRITPSLVDYYGRWHPLADDPPKQYLWIPTLFGRWIREIWYWLHREESIAGDLPALPREGEPLQNIAYHWHHRSRISPVHTFGLFRIHLVAKWLFWIAVASFAFHALHWAVTTTVWVPK